MPIEKQLTRMYDDGVERAVSVISYDVAHLPGCIINEHDIMLTPGNDIIDVQKVGDNLIAITPYNVLVNHGNANAHNTRKYSFNYTMIGNRHTVCNNNKDMIMHLSYDNEVIRFVKLLDNDIEEYNIALWPDETTVTGWCIYHGGITKWYVLTIKNNTTRIRYTNNPFGDWDMKEFSLKASNVHRFCEVKPVIAQQPDATSYCFYCIYFTLDNISYKFVIDDNLDVTNWTYSSDSNIMFNPFAVAKEQTDSVTSTKICRGFFQWNSTSSILKLYIKTPIKGSISGDVDVINKEINNKGTGDIADYKFGDILLMFNGEIKDSIGTICHIPQDTAECRMYGIVKEDNIYKIKLKYTLNLNSSEVKVFNTEPPGCFRCIRRDVGDERYNTTKAFYYLNGNMDFYTGQYHNSGFFYTYGSTETIITEKGEEKKHYDIKRKIDVTDKFISSNQTNEYYGEYEGSGSTTKTFNFTSEYGGAIPKMVHVVDTVDGHEMILFPKAGCGYCLDYGFTNHYTTNDDHTSNTTVNNMKVYESVNKVEIECKAAASQFNPIKDMSTYVSNIKDRKYKMFVLQ